MRCQPSPRDGIRYAASSRLRAKRLFDIVLGLFAIVFLAPLWILTGVASRICVRGSILFRQTRLGYHAEKFQILKFRTMHDGMEADAVDTQIPECGKWLRRLKLDELPQLINIVKGDMSFVGPRPYIEAESAGLPSERYAMRPGLTGLAQVNGNAELSWEERTAYDLKYIREFTLLLDLKILLLTARVPVIGEKACVRHIGDADR